MKSPFIQPRFDGARFSEHTLPLDVAKDLAAYEALLVDLAKHLYLQDHKERQRVPKGFAKEFHLHLERVEDGSTRPVLSVVAAGALALGAGTNVYFERARDLINECIASPQGQLPAGFPKELLAHFNQFGRSLREGERMELPLPGNQIATLTPERRKSLVLGADQVYEREIELSGTIEEADWKNSSFRLRTLEGERITVPMPSSFHPTAGQLGGKARHLVTFSAVAAYDSWDNLQKVIAAEGFEVQFNFELATRFEELRALQDGWFDGSGSAPDIERIDAVAEQFLQAYPEKIPLPAVVPTPEGDLLLEWNLPGHPSVDLSLADWRADFHRFGPDDSDEEQSFALNTQEGWSEFFEFLNLHVPKQA